MDRVARIFYTYTLAWPLPQFKSGIQDDGRCRLLCTIDSHPPSRSTKTVHLFYPVTVMCHKKIATRTLIQTDSPLAFSTLLTRIVIENLNQFHLYFHSSFHAASPSNEILHHVDEFSYYECKYLNHARFLCPNYCYNQKSFTTAQRTR